MLTHSQPLVDDIPRHHTVPSTHPHPYFLVKIKGMVTLLLSCDQPFWSYAQPASYCKGQDGKKKVSISMPALQLPPYVQSYVPKQKSTKLALL